jgi:hypothetical protein
MGRTPGACCLLHVEVSPNEVVAAERASSWFGLVAFRPADRRSKGCRRHVPHRHAGSSCISAFLSFGSFACLCRPRESRSPCRGRTRRAYSIRSYRDHRHPHAVKYHISTFERTSIIKLPSRLAHAHVPPTVIVDNIVFTSSPSIRSIWESTGKISCIPSHSYNFCPSPAFLLLPLRLDPKHPLVEVDLALERPL